MCGRRIASHDDDDTDVAKTVAAAPIQLLVGERDDYFSPPDAERAARAYGSEVRIHVQPGKGPGRMIECEEEMRVVMQFLADKLVRQATNVNTVRRSPEDTGAFRLLSTTTTAAVTSLRSWDLA